MRIAKHEKIPSHGVKTEENTRLMEFQYTHFSSQIFKIKSMILKIKEDMSF